MKLLEVFQHVKALRFRLKRIREFLWPSVKPNRWRSLPGTHNTFDDRIEFLRAKRK